MFLKGPGPREYGNSLKPGRLPIRVDTEFYGLC